MLAEADIVSLHVPFTESTDRLFDRATLAKMKPGAVLVNVARGGVVDETALSKALHAGQLRGAAMDVFSTEPLPHDNPLWTCPNLLISPHCSGVFDGWEDNSVQRFSDNLARYAEGAALANVVDPTRGY